MSREIKFRAWEGSRMRTWEDITDTLGFHHWILEQPKDIKLMQYTGLKDKNGKEIYEGDIVEEKNESGKYTYTIEWDKYDCCFYPKALNFKTAIEQRMSSNYTDFKVIGNIYENPDLLTKPKKDEL